MKTEKTVLSKIKKSVAKRYGAPAPAVTIDYPEEDATVFRGHYAVRLSVQGEGTVEISVNKGAWEPCRHGVGFYWFDWWPTKSGKNQLKARLVPTKGKLVLSDNRTCTVMSPSAS